jgi:competence transcription factor ComK
LYQEQTKQKSGIYTITKRAFKPALIILFLIQVILFSTQAPLSSELNFVSAKLASNLMILIRSTMGYYPKAISLNPLFLDRVL